MAVFTIFCHGTGEHRGKNKENEIIHDLSDLILGAEYQDFLILDGPGAGEIIPGTFDPFTIDKNKKKTSPDWSKTDNRILDVAGWKGHGAASDWSENSVKTIANSFAHAVSSGGKAGVGLGIAASTPGLGHLALAGGAIGSAYLSISKKARGNIYGEGMDDNIRHAIATLSELWDGDLSGKTINLIGWSRGAITCIRMANWIKEFYGSGPSINIFAIDPVAGNDLGTKSEDTYIIPDIVKKFIGIIVQDDKRGGFLPQDINRLELQSQQTEFVLLPFPGSHDTPCRATKSTDYSEVPHITRYLAYHFLNKNGTTFKHADTYAMFSSLQLSNMYANIKLKKTGYAKLGKSGLMKAAMGGITQRKISSELDKYISHDTNFFVNEHHVECFKKAHNNIYNLIFKPAARFAIPPVNTPVLRQRRGAVSGPNPLQQQVAQYQQADAASHALTEALGGIQNSIPLAASLSKPDNGAMAPGRSLLRTLS
mgnify:CR=1 FL=1